MKYYSTFIGKEITLDFGNIKKEKERFPIKAGMPFNRPNDMKIKKVGYKVIEFTYDVNPNYPDDKMLIDQKEVKRVIY